MHVSQYGLSQIDSELNGLILELSYMQINGLQSSPKVGGRWTKMTGSGTSGGRWKVSPQSGWEMAG